MNFCKFSCCPNKKRKQSQRIDGVFRLVSQDIQGLIARELAPRGVENVEKCVKAYSRDQKFEFGSRFRQNGICYIIRLVRSVKRAPRYSSKFENHVLVRFPIINGGSKPRVPTNQSSLKCSPQAKDLSLRGGPIWWLCYNCPNISPKAVIIIYAHETTTSIVIIFDATRTSYRTIGPFLNFTEIPTIPYNPL